MAIGDVGVTQARRTPSNSASGQTAQSFGAGIGQAINGLANAFNENEDAKLMLENAQFNRQYKMDNFETERRFQDFKRVQVQQQDDRFRDAPVNGQGLTNTTEFDMKAAQEEFLKTVPEPLREVYHTKLNEFTESSILGAFTMERKLGDTHFRTELTRSTNKLGADVYSGNVTYEEALASSEAMVEASDLTEIEKDELRHNSKIFLQEARFKADARFRLLNGEAMSTVPPAGQRLLDGISKPESAGRYNVRFGGAGSEGKTFDDYSRHPRIYERRADGRMSSAAGRYQFVYSTWVEARDALNLPDFSPESQDRAALWLAERDYNLRNRSGPRFQEILNSGDPILILGLKKSLGATWEGLPTMDDQEFLDIMSGKVIYGSSGDNRQGVPSMWGNSDYADIPFDRQLALVNAATTALNSQQTAENKAANDAQVAALQELYRGAENGSVTPDMMDDLRAGGAFKSYAEEEKLSKLMKTYGENVGQDKEVATSILTGAGTLTQDEHGNSLNRLYGDQSREAFGQMDTDYVNDTVLPLVDRLGFIPTDISDALKVMVNGADPAKRLYAMDALLAMKEGNPNLRGLGEQLDKDLSLYKAMLGRTPMNEKASILEMMDMRNDPAFAQILAQRTKDATKLLASNYPLNVLSDKIFDNLIPFNEPALPMDPRQQMSLQVDFNQNYTYGFETTGSDEDAFAFASEQVLKIWGVSELGGKTRIIKYGVEKFYQRPDLVDQQIRAEFGRRGISPKADYELIPSGNAAVEAAAFAEGKVNANASYQIIVTDGTTRMILRPPEGTNAWSFSGVAEDGSSLEYPQEQLDAIQENAKAVDLAYELDLADEALAEYEELNTPLPGTRSTENVISDDEIYQQLLAARDNARLALDDAQTHLQNDETVSMIETFMGSFDLEKDPLDKIMKAMGDLIYEGGDGVVLRNHPEFIRIQEILKRRRGEK